MDLVVNGPIKRHTRTLRAERIYQEFRLFRTAYYANLAKPIGERSSLKFSPSKPTLEQGLKDLFAFFDTFFSTAAFASGMKRCFQKTGTGPNDAGDFEQFKERYLDGSLQVVPSDTLDEAYRACDLLPVETALLDVETGENIAFDRIFEAFDRSFEGGVCPVDEVDEESQEVFDDNEAEVEQEVEEEFEEATMIDSSPESMVLEEDV